MKDKNLEKEAMSLISQSDRIINTYRVYGFIAIVLFLTIAIFSESWVISLLILLSHAISSLNRGINKCIKNKKEIESAMAESMNT